MEEQLLFIDFEFSMPDGKQYERGFYPEIIEAGIVVVRKQQIYKTISSYVTPVAFPKLTNRCKRFLGITQEEVDNGIAFSELNELFTELSANKKNKVVTWGNMDMKVLRDNCSKSNMSFPLNGDFIDLSMEYKRFFGNRNQTGLWKAVQEYGKDGVGKHHRALDDAMTTYHIYKLVEKDKQYMKKAEPTTIGDVVDFSKLFNNQLA
ncbi:sporulation inhibitor KapD [Oikeobacillus pervagus]|uniref:Sporulation inhibitor KapD n=1 Tax=Oikeobacillus pervagus TaxID=1325931 RepID=A0AAJ1T174_9BACI|nr:3'-5' exonuclease KapD [Oikeobacillus pervagus]MDQ0216814.1 sporulation inhibitor KapD [Oikeobacillus pervagus]